MRLERLREDPGDSGPAERHGDALESARPGVRHPPDQRRDRRPMRPGYPPRLASCVGFDVGCQQLSEVTRAGYRASVASTVHPKDVAEGQRAV